MRWCKFPLKRVLSCWFWFLLLYDGIVIGRYSFRACSILGLSSRTVTNGHAAIQFASLGTTQWSRDTHSLRKQILLRSFVNTNPRTMTGEERRWKKTSVDLLNGFYNLNVGEAFPFPSRTFYRWTSGAGGLGHVQSSFIRGSNLPWILTIGNLILWPYSILLKHTAIAQILFASFIAVKPAYYDKK